MGIVFARTRYDYPSYADFWALVEVSGFPVCFVDEIRLDANLCYITTPCNGETFPHIDNERQRVGAAKSARIVWWNLERQDVPGGPNPYETITGALERFDSIWVSDRHLEAADPRMKYVLMGSHAKLYDASAYPHGHDFDFCHYSYAWGRRRALYDQLVARGLREAPEAWAPADKASVISRSAVMLSAHQYEGRLVAPIRFAVAAAFGLPLVSEVLAAPAPFSIGKHLLDGHGDQLADLVAVLRSDEPLRRKYGDALHEFLCLEYPFQRTVEEAASTYGVD